MTNTIDGTDGTAVMAPARPVPPLQHMEAPAPEVLLHWLGIGDMRPLTPAQRVAVYKAAAESMGLNPFARPFDFIETRDKRIILYPNAVAAAQLRHDRGISVQILSHGYDDGAETYTVRVRGVTRDGRQDEALAAVYVKGVTGQALADGVMKTETKAKRRLTLAMCGLGYAADVEPGEWEKPIQFDFSTGEIREQLAGPPPGTAPTPVPAPAPTAPAEKANTNGKRLSRAELRAEYVRRAGALSALEIEFAPPLPDHEAADAPQLLGGCRALRGIAWESFLRLQSDLIQDGVEGVGLADGATFDQIVAAVAMLRAQADAVNAADASGEDPTLTAQQVALL